MAVSVGKERRWQKQFSSDFLTLRVLNSDVSRRKISAGTKRPLHCISGKKALLRTLSAWSGKLGAPLGPPSFSPFVLLGIPAQKMLGFMPCQEEKGVLLTDSGAVTVLLGVCYFKLWPL